MNSGSIEKVSIYAYTDRTFQTPNKAAPQPFYLPINPENYSENRKIVTDNRQGQGNQGTDPRYASTAPEELKLDFIFDGTGAFENYKYTDAPNNPAEPDKSVRGQLRLFLDTVYHMEKETHRPNFLKIHWGQYLKFPCILSSLDIQYTLFEANGEPLRAKISATFLNYLAKEEREALEKKKSPDLTRVRAVKAGDRLDLMTHETYNDVKYVLQVARFNNLPTLRRLKPGLQLAFPPVQKPGAVEGVDASANPSSSK